MAFGDLLQLVEDATSTDPKDIAYTSNVRAGSLLIVHATADNGTTITITDTMGNTWAEAAAEDVPAFLTKMVIKYAISRMSGANTITVAGAISNTTYVIEYEGSFDSTPLDAGTGVGDNGVSATASSGNFTTSRDGSLLLGFFISGNDMTVAGGWTADDDSSITGGFGLVSRLVQTTAGTDAATATLTSGAWIAVAAAFRKGISKTVAHQTLMGVGI